MSAKIELTEDGYERMETIIQRIEKHSLDGMLQETNRLSRFQAINNEVKKLRQTILDVFLLVPEKRNNNGDAA